MGLSRALRDPGSDLFRQGLAIAIGHFHDLHVRSFLDLGDESTAPKSDGRQEWDRSFEQPPHCLGEGPAVALHLADFVDQIGVHRSRRSDHFVIDQRNEALRIDAIAPHRNKRPKPDVSEDDTTPAQSNRLEADPLTLLAEFTSQETRQSKIAKLCRHSLQHGGLAAARGTGQEQVPDLGE